MSRIFLQEKMILAANALFPPLVPYDILFHHCCATVNSCGPTVRKIGRWVHPEPDLRVDCTGQASPIVNDICINFGTSEKEVMHECLERPFRNWGVQHISVFGMQLPHWIRRWKSKHQKYHSALRRGTVSASGSGPRAQ